MNTQTISVFEMILEALCGLTKYRRHFTSSFKATVFVLLFDDLP